MERSHVCRKNAARGKQKVQSSSERFHERSANRRKKVEEERKAHLVDEELPTPNHPSPDERHTVSAVVSLTSSDKLNASCTRCRPTVA
jgi:hypothetical protein